MTTPQLIAVDPDALARLQAEVSQIKRKLDEPQVTPIPEWMPIDAFANWLGKTPRTVRRKIDAGEIEAREIAGVRMVRAGVINRVA